MFHVMEGLRSRGWILLLALGATTAASAQVNPAVPLTSTQPGPAGTLPAQPTVQDMKPGRTDNEVLSGLVSNIAAPAPQAAPARPRRVVKAPPSHLTVKPGQHAQFGVAVNHLNRIITPFRKPVMKTTSAATTAIEQGIVYVSTQSMDDIALMIYDEQDPVNAISITLVPQEISPVSVQVDVAGYSGGSAMPGAQWREGSTTEAEGWEQSQPYVAMVKAMFRELAFGRVPQGYGFEEVRGGRHPLMPACTMPGMQVVPMQVLNGHSITTIVARATNLTGGMAEFQEQRCASKSTLAVAAWPRTTLRPGESTEVYIAVRRPEEPSGDARPSVLGGY